MAHYSLLDGLSQPKQIRKRIDALEMDGCALTDHGSVSGVVEFMKAFKGKKAIIGVEMYICKQDAHIQTPENRDLSHLLIYAKNDAGWKKLIQLISVANGPTCFYYKPRLCLEQLKTFCDGNLMCITGHLGSTLENDLSVEHINNLKDIFGQNNVALEVQLIYKESVPKITTLTEVVRRLGKETNTMVLATCDAHYCAREDAPDQRILLCRNMNVSLREAVEKGMLKCFFESSDFHIPSYNEMVACGHTEEELANTFIFANKCEAYTSILRQPSLPRFACPLGRGEHDYLKQLCRDGWLTRNIKNKEHDNIYRDRVLEELGIFEKAGISAYFLIIADILKFVRDSGWMQGPGRGSAAGCLVSYLIGITNVDPIEYDLLLSRFYNEGRNTKDRVSLPDIDIDIPTMKRDQIIEYIKNKYGHNHVAQIITYQTMQGRTALKDVLRAYGNVSFEEMNKMTENIPDKAKIAGELQEMFEETGESSLIRYTLENDTKGLLKEWCYIDIDGSLKGPLAKRFEQAIRLEGTKTAQSKHAAGIVISPEPISEMCPMVFDSKTKTTIAALEMNDLEAIGMVKFDILAITLLDKLMGIQHILRTGDIDD